jgi:hypothetical protein
MRVHHIGNVNKVIAVLGEHGVSQQKKTMFENVNLSYR